MFQSRIAAACLAVGISVAGFTESARAQQPPKPLEPSDYAALIRPKLPAGWRCFYDTSRVVITFDDEVTLNNFAGSSAPRGAPPESFRSRSGHIITLTFLQRISEEEYRQLIAERAAAVAAAQGDRSVKAALNEIAVAHQKFNVPNFFNDRHCIRLESTTLEMNGKVYGDLLEAPQAAIDGRNLIIRLLLDNMTPFEEVSK